MEIIINAKNVTLHTKETSETAPEKMPSIMEVFGEIAKDFKDAFGEELARDQKDERKEAEKRDEETEYNNLRLHSARRAINSDVVTLVFSLHKGKGQVETDCTRHTLKTLMNALGARSEVENQWEIINFK